jgi:hypothetical protein
MGDHIHRIDSFVVEHAGNAGLSPCREDLSLLRDLAQATAAGGFFLDQRGERLLPVAQGSSEDLATSLALEERIFRGAISA